MARKPRTQFNLDTNGIDSLTEKEIKIILRAADELVMTGGKTLLTKILAGSKDKKVLEHDLDECPVYGAFKGIKQADIHAKVNWMVKNDYLDIEYDGRLPLLVFSEKGWEIERETMSDELLLEITQAAFAKDYTYVELLKDRNREMILLLLDKIEASQNTVLLPILEAWYKIDYKKIRTRIKEVIHSIKEPK